MITCQDLALCTPTQCVLATPEVTRHFWESAELHRPWTRGTPPFILSIRMPFDLLILRQNEQAVPAGNSPYLERRVE